MAGEEGVEIDIISETKQLEDKSARGSVKRFASKAAGRVGLGKVAQRLNPDTEITFVEPLDPKSITIQGESNAITAPDSAGKKDVAGEIRIIESATENSTEPLDLDLQVEAVEPVRRVAAEIPTGTRIIGELDTRPGFERTIFDAQALRDMTTFMRSGQGQEMGGVIVGQFCRDQATQAEYTHVRGFIPKTSGRNSWGAISFAPEDWANMLRKLDEINRQTSQELEVVGWMHSHPPEAQVAPESNSLTEDSRGFGDRRIMRDHFPDSRFLTIIYGTGRPYDNQYAIWRSLNGSAVRQSGFEVNQPGQNDNYGYYTNLSELNLQ